MGGWVALRDSHTRMYLVIVKSHWLPSLSIALTPYYTLTSPAVTAGASQTVRLEKKSTNIPSQSQLGADAETREQTSKDSCRWYLINVLVFFSCACFCFFILQVSFITFLYFKLIDACCLSSDRNFLYIHAERQRCKTLGYQGIIFLSWIYIWNPSQKRSSNVEEA